MKNNKKAIFIMICIVTDIFAFVLSIGFKLISLYSLILLVLSEMFLLLFFSRKKKDNMCSEYVLGMIVDIKYKKSGRHGGYAPEILYRINGVEYKSFYTDILRRSKDYYNIGDEFWVKYDPNNPSRITQEDNDLKKMNKVSLYVSICLFILFIISVLFSLL